MSGYLGDLSSDQSKALNQLKDQLDTEHSTDEVNLSFLLKNVRDIDCIVCIQHSKHQLDILDITQLGIGLSLQA